MEISREMRLQKARTKILLTDDAKYVFLAHLCEVQDVIDTTIETACTDGSSIRWNPEYIDRVSDGELLAVLLHELLHIGLLHNVVARHYDDHKRLNIAADLAVNSILKDIGETLPKGVLHAGEGKFAHLERNKSLEFYYRALQDIADEELPDEQPGGIEPAGSEAAKNAAEGTVPGIDPAMAGELIRAMVGESLQKAEGCGTLPGSLVSAVKEGLRNKIDYRVALKRFRTKMGRGGADWTRPNKRLRASGANVARNKTRKVGDVIVLWDCSGSMGEETGNQCLAEILAIFDESVGTVHVWQHDVSVVHKDVLEQGKPIPKIERKTHGGTSHVEPFQNIKDSGLRPALIICLTDCCTVYPESAPATPTVWISAGRPWKVPPFGQLLDVVI